MLKFSEANTKTKALYKVPEIAKYLEGKRKVYSLDLPAGHSCPGAKDCLSKAVPRKDDDSRWTIQDGKACKFRCFSASQEAQYPGARYIRAHNFNQLLKCRSWQQNRDMLTSSLPDDAGVVRYHVSGDFFRPVYLKGAIALAVARPDVLFYTYTKSLHLLRGLDLPDNFIVTVSRGGKHDGMIEELGIREARVVYSEKEAEELGLPLDHDDSHGATQGGSFALLIHGTQPKGSESSKALSALKGKGSYGKN